MKTIYYKRAVRKNVRTSFRHACMQENLSLRFFIGRTPGSEENRRFSEWHCCHREALSTQEEYVNDNRYA